RDRLPLLRTLREIADRPDRGHGRGRHRPQGLRNATAGPVELVAETFHHAPQVAPAITQLEDVVVSGCEGLIKPDPAIFEILRERFGLDPVRTVFIDDLPANVEAARSLGFLGLVFTDAPRLRGDLRDLGLLGG